MIEYIRKAVCDRCGCECSSYEEDIIKKINKSPCWDVEVKKFTQKDYYYTIVSLQTFCSGHDEESPVEFVLCGNCVNDLGEFFKSSNKN